MIANLFPTLEDAAGTVFAAEDDRSLIKFKGTAQDDCRYDRTHCLSHWSLYAQSFCGLPQGGSASPTIAEHVVGVLLKDIRFPPNVILVNYADNFVFVGKSQKDVADAVNTLRSEFASRPGIPLRITDDGVRRLSDGFSFLGHKLRRQKRSVSIKPLEANIVSFKRRLAKGIIGILGAGNSSSKRLRARRLLGQVLGWVAAFKACQGIRGFAFHEVSGFFRLLPELRSMLKRLREMARDEVLSLIPTPTSSLSVA